MVERLDRLEKILEKLSTPNAAFFSGPSGKACVEGPIGVDVVPNTSHYTVSVACTKCPRRFDVSLVATGHNAQRLPDICPECQEKARQKDDPQAAVRRVAAGNTRPSMKCPDCFGPMENNGDCVCNRCLKEQETCPCCGNNTSEFLCPKCILAGVPTCDMCRRPRPTNASFCDTCGPKYETTHAGNYPFKEPPPAENPYRGGGQQLGGPAPAAFTAVAPQITSDKPVSAMAG